MALKSRQIFSPLFWLDAIERTLLTFVESALGFIIVGTAINNVDWLLALSVSLTASVLALGKALIAALKADTDTASLVVDSKAFQK